MDKTKNNREEPPRRPRPDASQKPRRQDQEEIRANPGQRPQEAAPAAPKRPRPESASRRPEAEQRGSVNPEREPSQIRREDPRQKREAPRQAEVSRPRKEAPQQAEAPRQRRDNTQREEVPRQKRPAPQRPAGQKNPAKVPAKSQKPAPKQGKTPAKAQKSAPKQRKAPRRPEQPDDLSSTKRAYGKSKPKKKSRLAIMSEAIAATAHENAVRRSARLEAEGKRGKRRSKQPTPAVIYTQPQAFNRDRLLVQLLTVTAVVVAFVVGISVFFKVEDIRVSGAEVYTPYSVEEASGIKKGANLLTFSRARAGALIKANLPYVKNVSFGIKLPGTVNIIIEEENVVYAIKDQDEQWWLINSNGRVVDQSKKGQAGNYTQVLGVALEHPLRDQMAVAVEAKVAALDPTADPTDETEEVVIGPLVSGAQRLETALQILRALEDNDIVGSAASINVSQPQNITLWYGTRYQVNLGDNANLEYKIACMNSVIMTMQEYQSGILDISFTIWPDQVGYTPFA